jgi:phosphatidate cytidylyltransferase
LTRLISGVVLAAAALAAILFLPVVALRALAAGVAAMAAHEYLSIAVPQPASSRRTVMAIVVAFVCWATAGGFVPSPFAVVALSLAWLGYSLLFADQRIQDAASELIATVYIGIPLGMLVASQILAGWQATLVLMGTVVVSDSAQYYTGRAFGRRPLAPSISPKKTVEGAIGGVVFGIVFMIVAGPYVFPLLGVAARAALGAVVVVLGILGDLFESRLKRTAGVKDSSSLIPGHGGVLDRIDALLFAIPAFYFMLVRSTV